MSRCHFHLVWWEEIELTRKKFPKMFFVWLTKHVAECCGTNLQLSYWDRANISLLYPCCGAAKETMMHIARCSVSGCQKILALSVSTLTMWMTDNHVDPVLINMVEEFILAQGTKRIIRCL